MSILLIASFSLILPVGGTLVPDSVQVSVIGSEPDYWPTDRWRNSTPEEHGMDSQVLDNMMSRIENQEYPIDSVLIVKDGYVVLEEYPRPYFTNKTLHAMHSVSKSVVSILLGVAFQQGILDNVSQRLLDFMPPEYEPLDPDPRWENITIEHLLTMTPGYEWDEWSTPYEYPGENPIMNMMYSNDALQFILDQPMAYDPGEQWMYNGGASVLLGAIIQEVYGDQLYYVFRDQLFDRIGIDSYSLPSLPGGWYNVMGGFNLRAVDMARLGFLYLNNGTWNGTQIVPADFVASSIQPIDHENPLGHNFGYGWHWWLRHDLGIYFAYGRHGQKIMVSQEHNMVVVFTASVPDDGYDPEFDLYSDYILRAITNHTSVLLFTPEIIIGVAVLAAFVVPTVVIVVRKRSLSGN